MLRGAIFVKPLPFVTRLIFICTPHRGSFLAGPQIIRRLVQRLIRLPSDVASIGEEMAGLSSGERYLSLERLPTSIDNMDPGNRLIRALSTIPIARGVAAHSIIAVDRDDDIQHGDDGVVTYESAHIDGVASELVVRSGHSAQANPHTIAEVQRILLDHLASVRAETSSIGTSHRTYPAGSPAMGTRRST